MPDKQAAAEEQTGKQWLTARRLQMAIMANAVVI